ncbi:unnamed protein product [Ilex paraguariensis]|uniref:Uncharacterized protein n=1 Tax=Ilex paraguariensis TaxID=185542 RepID=A0ABC8UZG4_9AQUA
MFLPVNTRFDQLMISRDHYHEQGEGSTECNGNGRNIGDSHYVSGGLISLINLKMAKLEFSRYNARKIPPWWFLIPSNSYSNNPMFIIRPSVYRKYTFVKITSTRRHGA